MQPNNQVTDYIAQCPPERQAALQQLREVFLQHLPKGFEEQMAYKMPTYVVPFSLYPAGYHCDAKQALPFISFASQKNFIAIYHMGIYAMPSLHDWFVDAYAKASTTKLDMGKSCMRFKKPEQIPFGLLQELASKTTVQQWITTYQKLYVK